MLTAFLVIARLGASLDVKRLLSRLSSLSAPSGRLGSNESVTSGWLSHTIACCPIRFLRIVYWGFHNDKLHLAACLAPGRASVAVSVLAWVLDHYPAYNTVSCLCISPLQDSRANCSFDVAEMSINGSYPAPTRRIFWIPRRQVWYTCLGQIAPGQCLLTR
ncbi:hypothetical protein LX36DRAFT_44768 [Colletotrichum falcatum]|nr:hypothetical protein LX36DRAFT_44768 [Colletotrichum falcatum]